MHCKSWQAHAPNDLAEEPCSPILLIMLVCLFTTSRHLLSLSLFFSLHPFVAGFDWCIHLCRLFSNPMLSDPISMFSVVDQHSFLLPSLSSFCHVGLLLLCLCSKAVFHWVLRLYCLSLCLFSSATTELCHCLEPCCCHWDLDCAPSLRSGTSHFPELHHRTSRFFHSAVFRFHHHSFRSLGTLQFSLFSTPLAPLSQQQI